MRRFFMVAGALLTIVGMTLATAEASPYGMTTTELSRAKVTGDTPVVKFRGDSETQVLKFVLKAGGTTGWHRHPEQAMFLVDKGTLTSYGLNGPPCDPIDVPAGQVLFAGPHAHHSHLVHNRDAEALEVTVLYFNLAPGQAGAVGAERPKECPADLK